MVYAFDFKDTGNFNSAIVVLLEAVGMLWFHFKKKYEHLKERVKLDSFLPMDVEKIDDERITFDNERLDEWTNACKNFLQNLKWLISMSQVEDIIKVENSKSG